MTTQGFDQSPARRRAPLCAASILLGGLVLIGAPGRARAQILLAPNTDAQSAAEPAPAGEVTAAPATATPAASGLLPRPRALVRSMQLGVGARAVGLWMLNGRAYGQVGGGGELLLRAAEHLSLELGLQYQRTVSPDAGPGSPLGGVLRTDIPFGAGVRLHLLGAVRRLSPYLAISVGGDYSFGDTAAGAWYFETTYGAGAELRLGPHAALTCEGRGRSRVRLDRPAGSTSTDASGQALDQQGVQVAGGAAVFF